MESCRVIIIMITTIITLLEYNYQLFSQLREFFLKLHKRMKKNNKSCSAAAADGRRRRDA